MLLQCLASVADDGRTLPPWRQNTENESTKQEALTQCYVSRFKSETLIEQHLNEQPDNLNEGLPLPSGHNRLTQSCFIVGPSPMMLVQH